MFPIYMKFGCFEITYRQDTKFRFWLSRVTVQTEFTDPVGNCGNLLITVKDTGVGIPEDAQQVIFDKFSQVDATYARKFDGAGLGLAIVKCIVTSMGGDIGLISAPNEGSVFSIKLPVRLNTEFIGT